MVLGIEYLSKQEGLIIFNISINYEFGSMSPFNTPELIKKLP